MKKVQKIGLLVLLSTSVGGLLANDVSRSFFSVRPYYGHLAFQNTLVEDAHNDGRALKKTGLQTYFFASGSTNASDLAKYFLFNNKTTLIAGENVANATTTTNELVQDIQVFNFNCSFLTADTFKSTITLDPHHTTIGFGFSARAYFREYFWASLDLPIVHVNNDLRLSENITNTGGGAGNSIINPGGLLAGAIQGIESRLTVTSMKDAFRQAGMTYGKIDGPRKKTGVGDMTLRIGYDSVDWSNLYMTTYLGVVLPTSNKPKAHYVFEPILGNNGHAGIIFGSRGQFDSCKIGSGHLWLSWSAESQYLFENTQKRSLDLYRQGPWSRYLSMFANSAQRTAASITARSFGINLMTQNVKVTPRLAANIDTNLSYITETFHANLGCTTNLRQSEEVSLANLWQEGPMVTSLATTNASNPLRTIGTELSSNDVTLNSFIQQDDINLESAAHPAYVSTTLHGSFGTYCQRDCARPKNYEAGASYEFSQHNASMNRWGVWAKAQISF